MPIGYRLKHRDIGFNKNIYAGCSILKISVSKSQNQINTGL